MKRRKFIKLAAASTSLLHNIEDILPKFEKPKTSSKLLIFATNWGYEGSNENFCKSIKDLGYDGAEIWVPSEEKEQKEIFATFKDYDLKMGFLCGAGSNIPQNHYTEYAEIVEKLCSQKYFTPTYLNNHSGKDFFDFELNKKMIETSIEIGKKYNVPIYHETHRGRILYSAPITARFLKEIPDLNLTLDISHWCNVHESLLENQEDTIRLALDRSQHIHARIGHAEGPQVNDPRAPEWDYAVKAHFAWWDLIVKRKMASNDTITFLTEFGPIDYMPSLPYTRQPVANQWDINVYMMKLLKDRYNPQR
ncbi:MAG: hypothetical protein RLZZ546_42 [Bacteroidota bacterium]|jgi:sugar phosphate isomerase/epimerase